MKVYLNVTLSGKSVMHYLGHMITIRHGGLDLIAPSRCIDIVMLFKQSLKGIVIL